MSEWKITIERSGYTWTTDRWYWTVFEDGSVRVFGVALTKNRAESKAEKSIEELLDKRQRKTTYHYTPHGKAQT